MPQEKVIDPSHFTPDVVALIRFLHSHEVRFMIVGGEAVIYYGHIRFTGDVDIFYDVSPENTQRLYQALLEFWNGEIPALDGPDDLRAKGQIFQFGLPPNRIDLLNQIDGVEFADAWRKRAVVVLALQPDPLEFSFIGLEDLIENKRAAARAKDLDDLPYLISARDAEPE